MATARHTITVGSGEPTAAFTASPTTPAHSIDVRRQLVDRVGTSTIVSYRVDLR